MLCRDDFARCLSLNWPHVGQVIWQIRPQSPVSLQRAVVLSIYPSLFALAQKIRSVRNMERLVAKPVRHTRIAQSTLIRLKQWPLLVLVSACNPLIAYDLAILAQGKQMLRPHQSSWMIDPASNILALQNLEADLQDLPRLYSLLSKPLPIQTAGSSRKALVWEKSLHGVWRST